MLMCIYLCMLIILRMLFAYVYARVFVHVSCYGYVCIYVQDLGFIS